MLLQPNDHLVFFGDSITAAHYDRATPPGDESGWGDGYVRLLGALLGARHPELRLRLTNRGNGGNRVANLEERLETDVLALRPDLVTVQVGINESARRFNRGLPTEPQEFAASYRRILEQLAGTGARLVLMEPFLLPTVPERLGWREDLNPRIEIVRALASEFSAPLVPLDRLFAEASQRREPSFWVPDGIHPSQPGHALIARAWLEAVGATD